MADDPMDVLQKNLEAAKGINLSVGYLKSGSGRGVLEYAHHIEFGTSKMPARPFVRRAADALVKGSITPSVDRALGSIIDSKITLDVAEKFADLGEDIKELIELSIDSAESWAEPRKTEREVSIKGSDGQTRKTTIPIEDDGHQLLIDTGDMRDNIAVKVSIT